MISETFEQLPPAARQEALDFIEYLAAKYGTQKYDVPPQFSWEGALKHLAAESDSVSLQHSANG